MAGEPLDRRPALGSAFLHLAAILAIVLLLTPRPAVTPETAVRVVMVPPPPQASPAPSPPQSTLAVRPASPNKSANPAPEAMNRAERLFSGAVLADPRSRSARQALATFAPDERMVQLCNIEAQEQVRRWNGAMNPDLVVAYAMADLKQSPHGIEADGGAFRSGKRWYNIRFDCTVAEDFATVVAFSFRIGDEIPRREWRSHNLIVDEDTGDSDD